MLWVISKSGKSSQIIQARDFDDALETGRAFDPEYDDCQVFDGCGVVVYTEIAPADSFEGRVREVFKNRLGWLLVRFSKVAEGFAGFEFWTAHPEEIEELVNIAPRGAVFIPKGVVYERSFIC